MQLVAQTPVLLVYLVGIVLALVFRARAALASTLALAGLALLLTVSIVQPFVFQLVLRSQIDAGSQGADIGRVIGFLGVVGSLLHAAGLGLLIAAVFAPRASAPNRADSLGA
jgi:hypothetical protein